MNKAYNELCTLCTLCMLLSWEDPPTEHKININNILWSKSSMEYTIYWHINNLYTNSSMQQIRNNTWVDDIVQHFFSTCSSGKIVLRTKFNYPWSTAVYLLQPCIWILVCVINISMSVLRAVIKEGWSLFLCDDALQNMAGKGRQSGKNSRKE